MAKGYDEDRRRKDEVAALGKNLGRRAKFQCEWCSGKDDLRPWDQRPDLEPSEQTVALFCGRCREVAGGKAPAADELYTIRNAVWSDIPAVAEGAAAVLARTGEAWAREAIEDSMIDETVKQELLRGMK